MQKCHVMCWMQILLALVLLTACNSQDPALGQTEQERVSMIQDPYDTEPRSVPEAESKPGVFRIEGEEHDYAIASRPESWASYEEAKLVIYVVDEAGQPVRHVSGKLEVGVGDNNHPALIELNTTGETYGSTGPDGILFYAPGENDAPLPERGALLLSAYNDSTLQQRIPMDLSTLPQEITVTWQGSLPPAVYRDPTVPRIFFHVVDREGVPVPHVTGALEQESDQGTVRRPLLAMGQDYFVTDAGGMLYMDLEENWQKWFPSMTFRLELAAAFDSSLQQVTTLELEDGQDRYTITWDLPLPPAEIPPQVEGIRLFFVDPQGQPVKGLSVGLFPFPTSPEADVVVFGSILGPSDENGHIRWEGVAPGEYTLYTYNRQRQQNYKVEMPEDQELMEITLVWNP